MKKKIKKSLVLILAALMASSSLATTSSALTPSYTPSSSYRSSSYYTALTNVKLTGNYRTDLVNVALSQVGYRESNSSSNLSGTSQGSSNYTEYAKWYGLPGQPWCAMLISWCARQTGIPTSIIKNSAVASIDSFGVTYHSRASGYTPVPGDLIVFGSSGSNSGEHIGIVVKVANGKVYTIEGNSSNRVEQCSYWLDSTYINGYGSFSSGGSTSSYTSPAVSQNVPEVVNVLKNHIGFKATLADNRKVDAFANIGDSSRCGRVYENDVFTVNSIIYQNNTWWLQISCPWDGYTYGRTVYVRLEDVVPGFSSFDAYQARATRQLTTYKHFDLTSTSGYVGSGDTCWIVASKNSSTLVLYPLAGGGWKLGWL